MPSSESYSIFRSFPSFDLSRSFVLVKAYGHVLFCSWKNAEISIHVRGCDLSYSTPQVLKTNHPVIAVLNLKNSMVCVDSKGHVYKIEHKEVVKEEITSEVHDDCTTSPSSPVLGSGKVKEETSKVNFRISEPELIDCEEIYYASFVPETEQLVFLLKSNAKLFFAAYNSSMKLTSITKIPYSIAEINPRKSLIKAWDSEHIDAQLKNVLFPALGAPAFIKFVVIIVVLSNGSVWWITSNNSCNGFQFLHKCHQSVAALTFFSIGGSKTRNTLCFILEGGPVLFLCSKDKKLSVNTQFLPSAAKAVYCKSDGSILSSDFTDCFFSIFRMVGQHYDFKTCLVSVKGIVKFSQSADDENIAIALTKLNFAYEIFINNIEPLEVSDRFLMPKKGVLADCMTTSKVLDNFLKQIKDEEGKLAAISLTMRASILHQFFNVSVKVYSGPAAVKYGSRSISSDAHVFKIKIENKCSFYEFSPKLWCISVILSLGSETSKSVHQNINLKQPFKLNNEIILCFPVNLKSNLLDLSLKIRLVSKQSSQSGSCPWLIIPLKSVPVGLVYFFTPLKNPVLSKFNATGLCIEQFLKKLSDSNGVSQQNGEHISSENTVLTYLIKLPKQLLDLHNIFSLVLNYSKYRCKENVWNFTIDNSKSICFASLFEKLIQFSLEKDCLRLQISGVDVHFFHTVKLAIINLLSSFLADNFVMLERSFLMDVQGSLQVLEISQVSESSSFHIFQDLRERMRSNIAVNLPP